MEHNEYRDIWDGIPTGPDNTWIQVGIRSTDKPARVVSDWAWVTGSDHGNQQPLVESTLTIDLKQGRSADGTPLTTMQVTHDELPIEWRDDMTACWYCKLEAGATVYRLAR
jgi:hypothetical protein